VLDSDVSQATKLLEDYETDLESDDTNLSKFLIDHLGDRIEFVDKNDFSSESIAKERNLYYQKQLANKILRQVNETVSKLTSTLNIHLNIGQKTVMNTSEVFMSLETQSIESLSNKQIKQVANAAIRLPSTFQTNNRHNSTVSLRVCFFSSFT
jgi:hypothetical protein